MLLLDLDFDSLVDDGPPPGIVASLPSEPNLKTRAALGVLFWAVDLEGELVRVDMQLRGHPDWQAILVFFTGGNSLALRQVLVSPRPGRRATGDITTEVYRAVRLGLARTKVRVLLHRVVGIQVPRFRGNDFIKTPRPGRKGRDDLAYAKVAAEYVQHLGERTPVKVLSAKLHLSESQVRNILHEARRRDLLTGSEPGRAGGALTETARSLLDGSR